MGGNSTKIATDFLSQVTNNTLNTSFTSAVGTSAQTAAAYSKVTFVNEATGQVVCPNGIFVEASSNLTASAISNVSDTELTNMVNNAKTDIQSKIKEVLDQINKAFSLGNNTDEDSTNLRNIITNNLTNSFATDVKSAISQSATASSEGIIKNYGVIDASPICAAALKLYNPYRNVCLGDCASTPPPPLNATQKYLIDKCAEVTKNATGTTGQCRFGSDAVIQLALKNAVRASINRTIQDTDFTSIVNKYDVKISQTNEGLSFGVLMIVLIVGALGFFIFKSVKEGKGKNNFFSNLFKTKETKTEGATLGGGYQNQGDLAGLTEEQAANAGNLWLQPTKVEAKAPITKLDYAQLVIGIVILTVGIVFCVMAQNNIDRVNEYNKNCPEVLGIKIGEKTTFFYYLWLIASIAGVVFGFILVGLGVFPFVKRADLAGQMKRAKEQGTEKAGKVKDSFGKLREKASDTVRSFRNMPSKRDSKEIESEFKAEPASNLLRAPFVIRKNRNSVAQPTQSGSPPLRPTPKSLPTSNVASPVAQPTQSGQSGPPPLPPRSFPTRSNTLTLEENLSVPPKQQ